MGESSRAGATRRPRRIELLDPVVADRIAAGEVIERPASIVKELVENSLDADAREIHVEVEAGGRERILVRDDGFGMSPEDAARACLRHATSKLRRIEELADLASLGFRGEALASIAAVSRLTITTRARGSGEGFRIELAQGRRVDARPVGAPVGTSVEVREIFAALPARRKFLRSAATEFSHVAEIVARVALAHPDVGLRCVHGSREVLRYPAVSRPEERLAQVLGAARAGAMRPVRVEEAGLRISGWVSRAGESFPQARNVQTFVGRRPVRDRLLMRAVMDAYRALLPAGRYPAAILFLEVPPGAVDVNVHPSKAEVRFANGERVYAALLRAVRDAVAAAVEAPRVAPGPAPRVEEALAAYARRAEPAAGGAGERREPGRTVRVSAIPAAAPAPARRAGAPSGRARFAELRIVGQALAGYIVCEESDGLVLVDQHAAHERVRFERLRERSRTRGALESQRLLVPRVVELGAAACERLLAAAEPLRRAGFDLEPFGQGAVALRALPASLDVTTDAEALLAELAQDLEETGASERLAAARDALLARIACHGAVRAGQRLAPEEMRRVIDDLDTIPFAATCPHGRPLLFELGRAEILRRVRRT